MSNQRPSSLAIGERKNRVVVRGTAGKRRSKTVPLSQKVTLERVLGISVKDSCALTCDTKTGNVAYIAGCVIVIFNPRKNRQFHIVNQSRKTLTALSFSGDGRYLVSGECGHNPAVRIWDVEEKTQVTEFHGHKFGVSCVAFSPNMQYVVSVGEQHDMVVNVWDWKNNVKHSSGKIATKVTGLAFSEDGSFFVAVGNRCVKFYYLMGKSRTRQILALPGRSGILGEQKNNFFCSVACGKGENKGKVYVVTKSGFLCELNSNRLLDKWVDLRTTSAHSIAADEDFIFVACDSGIVRLFNASSLHFITSLPKPHHLGVNVSAGIDASHMPSPQDNAVYPDVIAVTFDDENRKLTAVYGDHSLYIWDIHDVKKIGKQRSFLYHSACVFGIETYPELSDGNRAALPPGSFLTCSSDGTIRIWNVDPTMNTNITKRNIYSNELLKILYVDSESLESLQDRDYNPAGTTDKTDPEKGKTCGVRCIKVSPDGQNLASGDRSGNVRVHDLQFWDQLHEIEAHDSEVLCLEYTQPNTGYNLLASASRDRLIHVFDMDKTCSLVQTLDDHSSSILSVKFNMHDEQLQMVSCGADKALMFRMAVYNPDLQFVRNHHVVGKTTLYDLAIDTTQKFITTACQDRNLRIYNMSSGKLKRTYKGAQSDEGTLIRVELDPSGIYVATSCSDKSLSIYDFYSGECVATMIGHSELVTGIKFTSDCKQLISVSGDGCIFIWKLPWELTHNMKERLKEMGEKIVEPPPEYNLIRRGTYVVPPEDLPPKVQVMNAWQNEQSSNELGSANQSGPHTEDNSDEKPKPDEESTLEDASFDTGLLPLWAQKQVNSLPVNSLPSPTSYSSPTHPRGRWAQNINSGAIRVKSQMGEFNQSIELRLDECLDRRRYTVEPDALLEQVRHFSSTFSKGPFAGMEPEEISKLIGEDFVPASQKFGLHPDEQFKDMQEDALDGFVTTSRGSEPFVPPASLRASILPSDTNGLTQDNTADNEDGTNVEDLEGGDEDGEEEEEEDEDSQDSQEKIIFYPPQEDDQSSSPESLKFQVTESTKSHEQLAKRNSRQRTREGSKESVTSFSDNSSPVKTIQEPSTDEKEGDDADDEDEDEDEEEEEEDEEDDDDDKTPTASPRRSPVEPQSPQVAPDEEKFLHTNFSFIEREKDEMERMELEENAMEMMTKDVKVNRSGVFVEQEKFGLCLEQLQSGFASDDISSGRLSISSRFLSRSQHSQARLPPLASQNVATVSASMNAEEYLRRRKEEVARAVEETRKRLSSLGWAMGDKKAAQDPTNSAASGSMSGTKAKPAITPRMTKPQATPEAAKRGDSSPALSSTSSTHITPNDSNKVTTDSSTKPELTSSNLPSSPVTQTSSSAKLLASPQKPSLPPKPTRLDITSVISDNKHNDVKEVDAKTDSIPIDKDEGKYDLPTKDEAPTKDDGETNCDGGNVGGEHGGDVVDSNKIASKESSQDSSPDAVKSREKGEGVNKNTEVNSSPDVRSLKSDTNRLESENTTSSKLVKQEAVSSEGGTETGDANKENVSSVSLLNKKMSDGSGKTEGHAKPEAQKPLSGGERSNIAGRKSNLRRVASLNDLRKETRDKNESSPTLTSSTSVVRSASTERDPKSSRNSPARQRRREGAMLPLLPTPKTRSYEGKTESSMAKVVRRINESSPPPSPNALRKKKKNLAGGTSSPSSLTRSGPMKAMDPSLVAEAKCDGDANQDTNSETSVDSTRTDESTTSSLDRLAMPPPSTTHVSKTKGKRNSISAASKMTERGRKRSASLTTLTAASRARRASTSSLPSSDSRTKIPTPTQESKPFPKSPSSAAKSEDWANNKSHNNKPQSDISCQKPSKPVPLPRNTEVAKGSRLVDGVEQESSVLEENEHTAVTEMVGKLGEDMIEEKEEINQGEGPEDGTEQLIVVDEGTNEIADGMNRGVESHMKRKTEDGEGRKEEVFEKKNEEEEKSSSVSEDTMVSEATKGLFSSHPGLAEETSDTGGEMTPDDVKAMRNNLRLDLSEVSADEPEEDLGASLRESVDVMRKAFEQCVKCVAKIEKRGNHKTDLSYFNSAFSTMGKSYKSRVQPVVRRVTNPSPDNTLSDTSDDGLALSTDVFSNLSARTVSSIATDTARSLPSVSDFTGGGRVARGEGKRREWGETKKEVSEVLDASSPQAMVLLQHYSDMLINMVRSKMEDETATSGRSRVSSVDLETED